MRLIVDSLIAVMLAGILAGVLLYERGKAEDLEQCRVIHQGLADLQEAAIYHGALAEDPRSSTGFPLLVSPLWFDRQVPTNVTVPGRQPWLDIAPQGDMGEHPPDPVVTGPEQAGFWYNPNRGIFRARVAPQFSDQDTLALYNRLNSTPLRALPRSVDPARQPQAVRQAATASAPAPPSLPIHAVTDAAQPVPTRQDKAKTPRTTLVGAQPKRQPDPPR
jgi:hypothetical protein